MSALETAAGFRVRSGWAATVVVGGSARSPTLLERRILDLSDPAIEESRQPYHAARGALEEGVAEIRRRAGIVRRVTTRSVARLLDEHAEAGRRIRAAGLVVGSLTDPGRITNPHIRAHALEGQLFRSVLGAALATHGLDPVTLVERDAYAEAAHVLKTSQDELKRKVTAFGRSLEGPWRADQKLAALVAWVALAQRNTSI
ncbi:MAG: hypothetical protein ACREMD_02235 [Gemmatimonadota bacterium]